MKGFIRSLLTTFVDNLGLLASDFARSLSRRCRSLLSQNATLVQHFSRQRRQ